MEYNFRCAECKEEVEVVLTYGKEFVVTPCQNCIENAKEEAYDEGYNQAGSELEEDLAQDKEEKD